MGACGPQDVDKNNLLFREQSTEGTAEVLTAADGKTRVQQGLTPEYAPEREDRGIARSSLTPVGSVAGTKPITIPFTSEINTPDAFNKGAAFTSIAVESIVYQSAGVVRVTFEAAEDVTGAVDGDYLTLNYCTNSQNDGTWLIFNVVAASDYVDVIIRDRTSDAYDEAAASPAIGDIQINLEYQAAINCCGAHVKGMSRIAIVSVASGPLVHNEVITGNASSATGRVIVPCANGDSYCYFEPLTGIFTTADVSLTGSIAGIATISSVAPAVHAYHVIPRSNCMSIGTGEYQEDGFAWSGRDMMGNLSLAIEASKRGFFDFNMQGARESIGTKPLTSGITRSTEDPPISQNSALKFDAFSPVFSKIGCDLGMNVALRMNGNVTDDTGIEGARIAGTRAGKFTCTCELVLQADYDFYTKLDAGTKIAVEGKLGSAETKQFWYFFPYVELDELPLTDIDKLRNIDITGTLTGVESDATGDDEWEFAFIGN